MESDRLSAADPELVSAALAAARERGQDVADVPLTAIAAAAGISRSTLLRRLGGTRTVLDEAIRRAGVDPGGRPRVRERAIHAAAQLIADQGLGAVTLDAVATAAGCSLPSLHAVFDRRDGLLAAVFERYGPAPDLAALAADPPDTLEELVRAIYRAMAGVLDKEPRVLPAILADAFSRPGGPGTQAMQASLPRMAVNLRDVLAAQVQAEQLRDLPYPLLIQLLIGPIVAHVLMRPTLEPILGDDLPPVQSAIDAFTEAFLRAAAPLR